MEAMAKAKLASWVVSDALWERIEPLIPQRPIRLSKRKYARKPGGGRKPKAPRQVFEAIVYVLRTGCQWKALPREHFGSASVIHKRFLEWEQAGFFSALWRARLAEHDEMEGIAWRWQSFDGALLKAPPVRQSVRPNPTDRGKKRKRANAVGTRPWGPAIDRRNRG
jgi:transposase